jgi:hypothetical protein
VPTWADSVDAKTQLSQARQWAGLDPDSGQPLAMDREDQRKCAKCHQVQEHQGSVSLLERQMRLAYGSHPAGLEPLLAQAPDASASASAPPAAADTSSPAAAASTAASPAAVDTSSPAAAATTAAAPTPTPTPTPMDYNKLEAPLPLAEDRFVQMGTAYQVRVISKIAPSHSLVTHFVHKSHITLKGVQCVDCHRVQTTAPDVAQAGAGFFDMQLLPPIAVCAKCHNNAANGVGNKCGMCHDFHDKTRHEQSVILSPQSNRGTPGQTLAARLQTWGRR